MRDSVADDDAEGAHAAKCKGELEKGDGSAAACTETLVHDVEVAVAAAEFRVDDDEPDGPVCDGAEHDEEDDAGNEASLVQCIW